MINIEFAKPASAGFLMPGEKNGFGIAWPIDA